MTIKKSPLFRDELKQVLSFIARDKVTAMLKFRKELNQQLDLLKEFPKKYQKSIYFEDENIRDMTYMGYTIIYSLTHDKIIIMSIFNQNKP